jgi:hypothetical protein
MNGAQALRFAARLAGRGFGQALHHPNKKPLRFASLLPVLPGRRVLRGPAVSVSLLEAAALKRRLPTAPSSVVEPLPALTVAAPEEAYTADGPEPLFRVPRKAV